MGTDDDSLGPISFRWCDDFNLVVELSNGLNGFTAIHPFNLICHAPTQLLGAADNPSVLLPIMGFNELGEAATGMEVEQKMEEAEFRHIGTENHPNRCVDHGDDSDIADMPFGHSKAVI